MYSVNDLWFFTISVSTFRNLRIEAYLQLPAAYRSLSRLSSAPDAKAFSLCSSLLELLCTFCKLFAYIGLLVLSSRIAEYIFKQFWFLSPSFHNYLCFDLAKLYFFVTLNFKLFLERPNWFQFMSSSLNFFSLKFFLFFRVLINLFLIRFSMNIFLA